MSTVKMRSFERGREMRLLAVLTAAMMLFSFRLQNNQDEHTIKALFIYNFTKHIEWPKGKINEKFVIGVLGNSPVSDKLSVILKDRKIKDHAVEIRKINSGSSVENCDLLFIPRTESGRMKEIIDKNDFYGVLIITEDKDMAKKGACINIIQQEERIRFELNEQSLKKEGLKISNELYDLAVVIN